MTTTGGAPGEGVKSELFGYALLFGFAIALMLVIRHYSELALLPCSTARSPWPPPLFPTFLSRVPLYREWLSVLWIAVEKLLQFL